MGGTGPGGRTARRGNASSLLFFTGIHLLRVWFSLRRMSRGDALSGRFVGVRAGFMRHGRFRPVGNGPFGVCGW